MKLVMLAVLDSACESFARPMFVPAIGVAVRSFTDEVNRKGEDNMLNAHPEHFSLFELGLYDDVTGRFELLYEDVSDPAGVSVRVQKPRLVMKAEDVVRREPGGLRAVN